MADLHLVLPALNLSTPNAGISIMMQQVRLMMFSLNMVDYSITTGVFKLSVATPAATEKPYSETTHLAFFNET